MESIRKPFQGIGNIIRFNWHLYVLAIGAVVISLGLSQLVSGYYNLILIGLAVAITLSTLLSWIVSYYVYDRSGLYTLTWLNSLFSSAPSRILTFHAGFDETSVLLQTYFPKAHLQAFDFYDSNLHTEISIQRARKAYPVYPNTQSIQTSYIPLPDEIADCIFLVLAAHEIRNQEERIRFFTELKRVLKPSGNIIVVEHLRNSINFLAYTVGVFHFLPESAWKATFKKAVLGISHQFQIAHFITAYVLEKDGHSA